MIVRHHQTKLPKNQILPPKDQQQRTTKLLKKIRRLQDQQPRRTKPPKKIRRLQDQQPRRTKLPKKITPPQKLSLLPKNQKLQQKRS